MENFRFGYRHTLVPYEPEQKIIRYIFDLYDKGLTQRDIAVKLNEEGVTIRGRKWHQGTVSRILQRKNPD